MTAVLITPALRRAIMRANSDYFQMSLVEQEQYRVNMPDEQEFAIEQQLFRDLLDIKITNEDELSEAHGDLSQTQYTIFNQAILPIRGIGDDCFRLNEYLGDKSLLDFKSLFDYDIDDHEFQEKARASEIENYEIQPYRGSIYASLAQLFVNGEFTYGILFCAASYIYGELNDYGNDVLDALLPNEYVAGKDHGKREGVGFLHDMRVDAGGKEEQFEELQQRLWAYQETRYRELQAIWDEQAFGQAWQIPTPNDDEIRFIFSDKTALQAVRFRHFIKDFRRIEKQPTQFIEQVEAEKQRLEQFLAQQLAEIEQNFDPKITKFRKKRKIIMTPQAIADIEDLT